MSEYGFAKDECAHLNMEQGGDDDWDHAWCTDCGEDWYSVLGIWVSVSEVEASKPGGSS